MDPPPPKRRYFGSHRLPVGFFGSNSPRFCCPSTNFTGNQGNSKRVFDQEVRNGEVKQPATSWTYGELWTMTAVRRESLAVKKNVNPGLINPRLINRGVSPFSGDSSLLERTPPNNGRGLLIRGQHYPVDPRQALGVTTCPSRLYLQGQSGSPLRPSNGATGCVGMTYCGWTKSCTSDPGF